MADYAEQYRYSKDDAKSLLDRHLTVGHTSTEVGLAWSLVRMHDRQEAVIEAMGLLGSAYRGDWSDFDGRSLRAELQDLAAALTSDKPFDAEWWAHGNGICPVGRCWHEHCPDTRTGGSNAGGNCPHHEVYLAAWTAKRNQALTGANGAVTAEAQRADYERCDPTLTGEGVDV